MLTTVPKVYVTILSRCAEGNYGGFTNNSRVLLNCKLGEYGILAKILCKNISLIHKLSIHPLIKKELLRDVRTIRTIIEKSEKEVVK